MARPRSAAAAWRSVPGKRRSCSTSAARCGPDATSTNLRTPQPDQPDPGGALASEADVENDLLATLHATAGLVVALGSAQNLDRLVTVYRAAKRAGRRLGIDLYTAEVAASDRQQ